MIRTHGTRTMILAAALILVPRAGDPCCMAPAWYEGEISQSTHEAIVLHDGTYEELILRINIGLTREDRMPQDVAWIVTVPSVPDAYDASVDRAVFDEMRALLAPSRDRSTLTKGMGAGILAEQLGAELQIEVFLAGPYEIHQINTVGSDALVALNEWLGANGFPVEEPEHMRWFVDRDVTWLCIKVRPPDGEPFLTDRTDLPPLRVGFRTDRPFYPLKFSSRQGVFPLDLFVLSADAIDLEGSAAALAAISPDRSAHEQHNANRVLDDVRGEHLTRLLGTVRAEGRLHIPDRWYGSWIRSSAVNTSANPISGWSEDFYLGLASAPRPAD